MNRDGWLEITHIKETLYAHSKVAEKKEELIKEFISITKSQDYINNIKPYKEEVAKSCIRSSLRFSSEAMEFTKLLVGDILETKLEYSKYYVTLPYILFHLPNDKSEQSVIHTDRIKECQNSITVWTPINTFKNTYPPISIFPKSHSFLVSVCQKLVKKIFPNLKQEGVLKKIGIKRLDIYPSISSSYIWSSELFHMGNLNSSENYHCALVIKITEKPLYHEPSVECKDLIQRTNLKSIEFNLLDMYKNLSKHIESIEKMSLESLNIEEFISNVYDYRKLIDLGTRRALSFTLALVAGRYPDQPSSNYFDLASYMVEKEHIVALERHLRKCNDKKVVLRVFNKLSKFEKFNTYQEFTLFNKLKQRFKVDAINLRRSSAVHDW